MRTTTAYVSGYDRTREQVVRLPRGETRTLMANFNGVLDAGETIDSATWRVNVGSVLSDAAIASDGRSTHCTVQAASGCGSVKVQATTSDDRVLTTVYAVEVEDSPWFEGETPITSGAQSLTVTAS